MNTAQLFEKHYYGYEGFVDGTRSFHATLAACVTPGSIVLEIGAGPSNQTSRYLASRACLYGIDVTEEVKANEHLDKAIVYDGRRMPVDTASVAGCASDFVLEHIQDPQQHFAEVSRVLRPGGYYCFRTPNLYHYVPLVSRLLPHQVHLLLANRLRGLRADEHPPYQTYYRANTVGKIKRLAAAAGLRLESAEMLEPEPSYGRTSALLFYPMMAYERIVNRWRILAPIRVTIIAVVRKTD